MNTEATPQPTSALFPDVAPEHYADAAAHAAAVSTEALTCDADDVLLAAVLSRLGGDMIESQPGLRTKAIIKLFDPRDIPAQRCMIGLAKMLRQVAAPTPAAIEAAVMAFVPAMVSTLFVVAPDKKKMKHPRMAERTASGVAKSEDAGQRSAVTITLVNDSPLISVNGEPVAWYENWLRAQFSANNRVRRLTP